MKCLHFICEEMLIALDYVNQAFYYLMKYLSNDILAKIFCTNFLRLLVIAEIRGEKLKTV